MTYRRMRRLRRLAVAVAAGGMMYQAAGCNLTGIQTAIQSGLSSVLGIAATQAAGLLSDTVFFVLDNLLVRARG